MGFCGSHLQQGPRMKIESVFQMQPGLLRGAKWVYLGCVQFTYQLSLFSARGAVGEPENGPDRNVSGLKI
jgi:hypothetical protein